jgi:hypothetical protein
MNDTLQNHYDKNNGRLPTDPIPDDKKEHISNNYNDTKCCKSTRIWSNRHRQFVCKCCGMKV